MKPHDTLRAALETGSNVRVEFADGETFVQPASAIPRLLQRQDVVSVEPLPTTNIVGPTPDPPSDDPRVRKIQEYADALGACSSFLRLYADELVSLRVGEYDAVLIGVVTPHGDHEAMITLYVYGMESEQDLIVQRFVEKFGEFELRPYAGHDHYERRFDTLRLADIDLELLVPVTLSLQIVKQATQFPITRKDA